MNFLKEKLSKMKLPKVKFLGVLIFVITVLFGGAAVVSCEFLKRSDLTGKEAIISLIITLMILVIVGEAAILYLGYGIKYLRKDVDELQKQLRES